MTSAVFPSFLFDATSRSEVVDELVRLLAAQYVYPDHVTSFVQHLRNRQESGAYDALEKPQDFCHRLTLDL